MVRRDKVGLGVLVLLFVFFIGVLVWTLKGTSKPSHDFSESIFTKQRIVNLKK